MSGGRYLVYVSLYAYARAEVSVVPCERHTCVRVCVFLGVCVFSHTRTHTYAYIYVYIHNIYVYIYICYIYVCFAPE